MLGVVWINCSVSYDDDVVLSCDLRRFVTDMFLNDIITDDIIMFMCTYLSFSLFSLLCCFCYRLVK